ncbi:unnamed protein product [Clavelina lepadiformis]|uniref:Uncharacterized protein n=1 Tax=Clavelina lepadiformis TaxID=159417 RepID=A0ABP0G769_CLALP
MTSTIKELFLACDSNPSPLRVANRALDGCPKNPGFVFNKTADLENNCGSGYESFQNPLVAHHKQVFGHIRIKLRTKAQSEFCSHSASVKRCSSVQKQSLAEQDVTDERDKVIDQIISLKDQAGITISNIFPKDGAFPFYVKRDTDSRCIVAWTNITSLEFEKTGRERCRTSIATLECINDDQQAFEDTVPDSTASARCESLAKYFGPTYIWPVRKGK